MVRRKLTLLTLAGLLLVAGLQIGSDLAWVSVSMTPENASGQIELGAVTGSELIPVLAALMPVLWLGVIVSLLLRSRIWLGYSLLTVLGAMGVAAILDYNFTGDTSAVGDQIMSWQNVAAAHDVSDLNISRMPGEWIALGTNVVLTLGFAGLALVSFRQRATLESAQRLVSKASRTTVATAQEATIDESDSILLWDNQRPAK